MTWYHLFSPTTEKWLTLLVFASCFALILYRNIKIGLCRKFSFEVIWGMISPSDPW